MCCSNRWISTGYLVILCVTSKMHSGIPSLRTMLLLIFFWKANHMSFSYTRPQQQVAKQEPLSNSCWETWKGRKDRQTNKEDESNTQKKRNLRNLLLWDVCETAAKDRKMVVVFAIKRQRKQI